MRCKKHFSDVTSTVGVCASCLQERLAALIEAQTNAHRLHLTPSANHRNSDAKLRQPHQPPIVFPRSVSPYISRRKSDTSVTADQSRFFSTPQVGPTSGKKKSKFHAITNLFRSRSAKSARLDAAPLKYSSWLAGFVSAGAGHRHKTTTFKLFSLDEKSAYDGRREKWFGHNNRGLSPDAGEAASAPGSPEPWKGTPCSARGSARAARLKASPARSHVASGFGICLSPLMRPSPSRHRNGKSVGPGATLEPSYSGDMKPSVKPHLSSAASMGANRSRKIAGCGRFNHNR